MASGIEDDEVSDVQDEAMREQSFVLPAGPPAKRFPIPVFAGKIVVVEGEFPLSEDDWNQFMSVLGVMKPALVTPQTAS